MKKKSNLNSEKTKDTLRLLQDMKALERDILQDPEYIKRYYLVDDAIRNKGKLTLISPYYIEPFSKLSQFISNKYQSIVKMKKTSKNVKIEVEKEFTIGNQVNLVNEIVAKSKIRLPLLSLDDVERSKLVKNLLDRVSNAKIGNTIRNFRSNNLTRVNDVQFRTNLKVLSVKKESYNNISTDM